MQNDIYVSVKQISRYYGTQCAVHNVSFDVKRGEVLGFLGPNGAGKSTTMAMITGNLAPSAGQILINGIDILDKPKDAKAHIGFLPEQPPLYRDFTVDEYLRFCAKLNRISKKAVKSAVDTVKARCGLTDVGKRLIDNLSKGYQQRVGIAQAIVHSPAVVILDEPTVGLDPIQIREIRHLIRELSGEHSVILSTHILPEIQVTCDRVQILNKGKLVLSDTVAGIEQQMKASSLVVALKHPPEASELAHIPQVSSATLLENGRFRLVYDPHTNPAEHVVQAAVENNWGLYEIFPEKRSLEQIFVDITTSEKEDAPDSEHKQNAENQAA